MKKISNSLNLRCAIPFGVSNGGLEFDLGGKSILGRFFNAVLILGYLIVVLLFLLMQIFEALADLDKINFSMYGNLSISVGAITLLLFILSIIVLCYFSNIKLLATSSSMVILLLLFSLWSYGVYLNFESDFKPILLYLPLIIIVAHAGKYIIEVRKGYRLTIRLLSNTYKINYCHKVVDEGVFSQDDIEIRVSDTDELGNRYSVVFLPATKRLMGYVFDQPSILHAQGFGENIPQEIEGDLEKIFNHLDVSYENNSWIVKK